MERYRTMEIELKFRVDDAGWVKARLEELGHPLGEERPEENRLYDTSSGSLRKRGLTLRIRSTPDRLLLTAKMAMPERGVKARREEEIELHCSLERAERLLALLGLVQTFGYRKRRSTCSMDGVTVCLDRLSIGDFVEIEGGFREEIRKAALLIGLDAESGITDSYPELLSEGG
jgi:predicted adenylyl cyclase CyaB